MAAEIRFAVLNGVAQADRPTNAAGVHTQVKGALFSAPQLKPLGSLLAKGLTFLFRHAACVAAMFGGGSDAQDAPSSAGVGIGIDDDELLLGELSTSHSLLPMRCEPPAPLSPAPAPSADTSGMAALYEQLGSTRSLVGLGACAVQLRRWWGGPTAWR